jgi:hypothetical protein
MAGIFGLAGYPGRHLHRLRCLEGAALGRQPLQRTCPISKRRLTRRLRRRHAVANNARSHTLCIGNNSAP